MTRKQRLNADDWVAIGLSELACHGPDAVKLEAICAVAGLTRGSFYHHFESHGGFLCAIAQAWKTRSTEDIAQGLRTGGSAKEDALTLTAAVLAIDFKLELGIRELARRSPEIAQIVQDTDQIRLALLSGIYAERFSLGQEAAADFAFLEYAAFSGMILLNPDMAKSKQQALAAMYDGLLERALLADE